MSKDTSITILLTDTIGGISWQILDDKRSGTIDAQCIAKGETNDDDPNEALAQAIAAIPADYSNSTTVNTVANDEDLYCEPLGLLRLQCASGDGGSDLRWGCWH